MSFSFFVRDSDIGCSWRCRRPLVWQPFGKFRQPFTPEVGSKRSHLSSLGPPSLSTEEQDSITDHYLAFYIRLYVPSFHHLPVVHVVRRNIMILHCLCTVPALQLLGSLLLFYKRPPNPLAYRSLLMAYLLNEVSRT
jgi:hypothetical protein